MVLPYAVVSFLTDNDDEDQVTSEVPSCWLTANKQKCWWPKVKNISYLISKRVLPDPDNPSKWTLHEVSFENYYDTIEHARKKAEFVSSGDERDFDTSKSRNSRKRKKTSLKTVQETSDEEVLPSKIKQVQLPSPPASLNIDKTILIDDIPILLDYGEQKLQGTPRVIAEYKSASQLNEAGPSKEPIRKPRIVSSQILHEPLLASQLNEAGPSKEPIRKPRIISSQILHEPLLEMVSAATGHKDEVTVPLATSSAPFESNASESDSNILTQNDLLDTLRTGHDSTVNHYLISSTPKSSQIPIKNSEYSDLSTSTMTLRGLIETKFDLVFRRISEISVAIAAVKDIVKTLQNRSIEKSCSGTNITYDVIEAVFPFKNQLQVAKFEADLGNTISQSNVVLCLQKVGGTGMKDSLIRILRKVFSNQLATKSSWLGQRGNFKINDLAIMKCIKDVISTRYNHTDKEFDEVASEWFRQAHQRLVREVLKESKKNNTL